jgi:hypothetical protein
MESKWPNSIPDRHRTFLNSAIDQLQDDPRIVGVAAGGSFLSDSMDEFSDIDLVIAVELDHYDSVMIDRHRIASTLGPLLAAFTGEHVGEPRLLICLYNGTPILHVDLKFVALSDAAKRVEDSCILWERDFRFTKALTEGIAEYPIPNLQWIEDRFWVWIHYATTKIGRGELFEALDGLSFIRGTVLGPLVLSKSGARPSGVRKIEQLTPEHSRDLQATVASYNTLDCLRALRACANFYRTLRGNTCDIKYNQVAEDAAMHYLLEMEQRCTLTSNSTK